VPDGGIGAVAGMDDRGVGKRQQHAANRVQERLVVAARQIGPADRPGKQRIPHEEMDPVRRDARSRLHRETHASRTVPGRVVGTRREIADRDGFLARIEVIDRRRRIDVEAEQPPVLNRLFVQKQIVAVQPDRQSERALGRSDTRDVVYMGVGEQHAGEREALARRETKQRLDLVAGIDEDALAGPGAGDDKSVLEERTHRLRLDYDHRVILAILDDLLFTSKIRATAKQLGATLAVAKSRDAALAEMRASGPALVILDLNNPRTDPLGVVAGMKADPALAAIQTVGFVSHVHTDLIDAARKAGVDVVMARSMFAERLPEILARGQ
jgi:CheY-like chemotaxis protein